MRKANENLKGLLERSLQNWPQKLGAVILAILIWLFVSTNDSSTTQRSLLVPITVEGLQEDRVAVGLPDMVEVTISGPSNRINRLRPENISAVLDLSGMQGEFRKEIRVEVPGGISVQRLNPNDVIGFLETVREKQVSVAVVILGPPPTDTRFITEFSPATVTVRGRPGPVDQVAQAIAPINAAEGKSSVTIFAADTQGQPVADVVLEPAKVTVQLTPRVILEKREVEVELVTPVLPPFTVDVRLDSPRVTLVGPESKLAGIDRVTATVELATPNLQPGRYTRPVRLQLPADVNALEVLTATVVLTGQPLSQ